MYTSLLVSLALVFGAACTKEADTNVVNVNVANTTSDPDKTAHRGVSFVSPSNPIEASSFDAIVDVNSNWTAIIPFGFIGNGQANVQYNIPWQWWGERDEGVRTMISQAHSKNIKIMLKPQIWLMGGAFTGNFTLNAEQDWQTLEDTYSSYILHFADVGEELGVETYCIGTELKTFIAMRPQFWSDLIDSVRVHFSGELTYAGNWDSYQAFPHWQKLDYIGIDAYFPVSDMETPSVQDCIDGWQPHYQSIKTHQAEVGKPVLFTEYGYRSVNFCGKQPWDSSSGGVVNEDAQQNAYDALFQVFWDEDWFDGGYLWKWYPDHSNSGGSSNTRFTPQNKKAEQLIKTVYGS